MFGVTMSEFRRHPTIRMVAALIVAVAMWGAAMLALATALVSPMLAFGDAARRTASRVVFVLASVVTVFLFFGSGPVAYRIARRRWLLALPLIGLGLWGMGALIAYAT